MVGWLEFNVPFQHKYGYIRDEHMMVSNLYVVNYDAKDMPPAQQA